MKKIINILLIFIVLNSCKEARLPGYKFQLFEGTPVEKLSNAVEDQDTAEIERILKSGRVDVNYQESKTQKSLLMLAVVHDLEKSVKKLLEFSADPNLTNKQGYSSVMIACESVYVSHCKTSILEMLIEHGGDVNAVRKNAPENIHLDQTVLMIAVSDARHKPCNDKAYFLVENGADIDAIVHDSTRCAVNSALSVSNLDAVRYLLIEKHAKIPEYALIRFKGREDEEKVTFREILNGKDYTNDPHRDKIRRELLAYLKSKGY